MRAFHRAIIAGRHSSLSELQVWKDESERDLTEFSYADA